MEGITIQITFGSEKGSNSSSELLASSNTVGTSCKTTSLVATKADLEQLAQNRGNARQRYKEKRKTRRYDKTKKVKETVYEWELLNDVKAIWLREGTEEEYTKFWNEFGKSIKLGIIEDVFNRNRLAKLLRFETTKSDGKLTSLDQYIKRMKTGQKDVFYITGSSKEQLEKYLM